MKTYRTHTTGSLSLSLEGREVVLSGWVHRRRDHGGIIFIDLRDADGLVQVVFNPAISPEAHERAQELRNEYVIRVRGKVVRRPPGTENPKIPTGEIEISAEELEILNRSRPLPFPIAEERDVDEALRLKYRFLDLRRPKMRRNLILRHKVIQFIRLFLWERGFVEIETPILIKSTPEGARDYLVPSRLHPGRFYALPQSPQQLKQILMVAGFEKYFQIARCFRDEDLRADRQPEFTQLDIEMSFVNEEDILNLVEELFTSLVEHVTPHKKVLKPFPRLSYRECMEKYGTDKPDLRFGLELRDLSDIAAESSFGVFRNALESGGVVKGFCAPGCAELSRKEILELTEFVKARGAKGLVTIGLGGERDRGLESLSSEDIRSVAAKYLTPSQVRAMAERVGARRGDAIFIIADKPKVVNTALSQLRAEMGRRLGLAPKDLLAFAFILDFPLLEWNEEEGRWEPMHHPFTAPVEEDIPLLDTDPGKVRARHYDFVCNGCELSSGSIRIHRREVQEKIFRLLGYSDEEMREKFGALLEALDFGAPPHGGIAPGIDRLVMLLADEEDIREVIAFPKTKSGADLLFGAPAPVTQEQLDELHISLREGG